MTILSPRERLLAAAADAFRIEGFEGAHLGRIATAAGVSKRTIYEHAKSKVELFALVIEDIIARTASPDLIVRDEGEAPEETLRRSLLAVVDLALSPDGLLGYRLVTHEVRAFPELFAAYQRPLMPFLESLVRWFVRQQEKGWLRPGPPDWQARMLLGMTLNEARRDALYADVPPPDMSARIRMVDDAINLFLNGARVQVEGV